MSANPTATTAPKKPFWSKVLKVTKDVLGFALMVAGTPGGAALIAAKVPAVYALILKWGLRPLANVLDLLPDGVEITDEVLVEALAKKGGRLEPIDLTTFFDAEPEASSVPPA